MTENTEIAMGFCYSCAQLFTFDVQTVPSVVVDLDTGRPVPAGRRVMTDEPRPQSWVKQPLCDPCADKAEAVATTLRLFPLWPARQAQQGGQ